MESDLISQKKLPVEGKIAKSDLMNQKDLLAKGKIEKVLENLLALFQDKDKNAYNETVTQSCIFFRLEMDKLSSTMAPELYRREEFKIIKSLLKIIDCFTY